MKTYQALFIFSSSLADDVVQETLQTIRNELDKAGGTITATEMLGKRMFARPMKKMETGQYVKLLLQIPPAALAPFTARLRLNERIFRMQIVEMGASLRKSGTKKAGSAAQPVAEGVPGGKPQ